MTELSREARHSVARQADLFRIAKDRDGLSRAALSTLAGIPESTLKGWARDTVMPAWGLGALASAGVADDLLSLVLDPFGMRVTRRDDRAGAIEALGCETARFTAELVIAQVDGRLDHRERAQLVERARAVAAAAIACERGGVH